MAGHCVGRLFRCSRRVKARVYYSNNLLSPPPSCLYFFSDYQTQNVVGKATVEQTVEQDERFLALEHRLADVTLEIIAACTLLARETRTPFLIPFFSKVYCWSCAHTRVDVYRHKLRATQNATNSRCQRKREGAFRARSPAPQRCQDAQSGGQRGLAACYDRGVLNGAACTEHAGGKSPPFARFVSFPPRSPAPVSTTSIGLR